MTSNFDSSNLKKQVEYLESENEFLKKEIKINRIYEPFKLGGTFILALSLGYLAKSIENDSALLYCMQRVNQLERRYVHKAAQTVNFENFNNIYDSNCFVDNTLKDSLEFKLK